MDAALRHIERVVAEWIVAGLVLENDAPTVVRIVHSGYFFVRSKMTLQDWCGHFKTSLHKVDAMTPAEYKAAKRLLKRAARCTS
jgi:hypothetical protein